MAAAVQIQDMIDGRLPPNNPLFLAGGPSNYTHEVLRPHGGGHFLAQTFKVDKSPVTVASRGLATIVDRPLQREVSENEKTTFDLIQPGIPLENLTAPGPAHGRDLKEIGLARTQELIDAEKEVLHYTLFTRDVVVNSTSERERTRTYDLYYHVSDGSLRIYEPAEQNSGLLQGEFAKRHVAPKPDGSGAYGPLDFYPGAVLVLRSREFTVVDADPVTRQRLMDRYGVELGPGLAGPTRSGGGALTGGLGGTGTTVGSPRNKVMCDVGDEEDATNGFYRRAGDTRAQFLEHGAAMLRFEAEWVERGAPFTDRRRFALQYYLADDTVEVLDKTSPFSRGGQFSKFLQRQRLPRVPVDVAEAACVPSVTGPTRALGGTSLPPPNAAAIQSAAAAARLRYTPSKGPSTRGKTQNPITGAQVYSPKSPGGGPASVSGIPVLTSEGTAPFVTAADLVCGGIISVYGRPLLLKTCDPYTVAFCLLRLGFDQRHTFLADQITTSELRAELQPGGSNGGRQRRVPLPPHTGAMAIGGEEETRHNADRIIPDYKSSRDWARWFQLGGKALRFDARMDPTAVGPDDARRRFTIAFYLEDSSIAIGEIIAAGKGGAPATVKRFLNRGRYRNASAGPDLAASAAIHVKRSGGGATPLPPAVAEAYDRVFGGSGDKYGYSHGFGGQGYGGGIYGLAERTGAGGTGSPAPADMGVRCGEASCGTLAPTARFFDESDFTPGARLRFEHMPDLRFILGEPDAFTAAFRAAAQRAAEAGGSSSPLDVYVPENEHPLPSLPLESVRNDADADGGETGEHASGISSLEHATLLVAKILAGVSKSAYSLIRQGDRCDRGFAPVAAVAEALARFGVADPAVHSEDVSVLLSAFTIGPDGRTPAARQTQKGSAVLSQSSSPAKGGAGAWHPVTVGGTTLDKAGTAVDALHRAKGVSPAGNPTAQSAPSQRFVSGTTIGTLDDPLAGPFLRDYLDPEYAGVPMVDYRALFAALHAASVRQQALQPRMDKVLSQLRAALLSSRGHLRKMFRDLDTAGAGAITQKEFRMLLQRHHLDIGLSDAQLLVLMSRFPAAPESTQRSLGQPAISWIGFVESLLDAGTLSPQELDRFLGFVKGIHDSAPEGVGTTHVWPEVFPHANAVSHWEAGEHDLEPFLRAVRAGEPSPAVLAMAAGGGRGARPPPTPSGQRGQPLQGASTSGSPTVVLPLAPPRTAPAATAKLGVAPRTQAAPVDAAPPAPRPQTAPAPQRAPPAPQPVPITRTGCVDPVIALGAKDDAEGAAFLSAMRGAFAHRRFELFRALSLYDTARRHSLSGAAFVSALVSAGLKLNPVQADALRRRLAEAAPAQLPNLFRVTPHPEDVSIDYASFTDRLFL